MAKSDFSEKILQALKDQQDLKLPEITRILGESPEDKAIERALQRALKALIEQDQVKASGQARARTYRLAPKMLDPKPGPGKSDLLNEIELTVQAKKVLNDINRPLSKRTPVGYQQSFLRDYRPNQDFYLSASQREELFKLGLVSADIKPAGTYARDILNRLLIDLSWNSSRLEGNTYSFLETQQLIEKGQAADGKDATEAVMILNHKAAIQFLVESARDIKLDQRTICNLHALLSDNLLGDPSASGRLRRIRVDISGSTYLPLDNPHLIEELFNVFLEKISVIKDPFEQCFFALVHLSYLQAFEDVNKRTSRLAANISLVQQNLKPLAFVDVDQEIYLKSLLGIYEKNDVSILRDLFMWAYRRSTQRYSAIQQSLGEPNLLKLKYRSNLHEIIRKAVRDLIPQKELPRFLAESVKKMNLPENKAKKFLEILEIEISSLHEGNFARYQLRESEFLAWNQQR